MKKSEYVKKIETNIVPNVGEIVSIYSEKHCAQIHYKVMEVVHVFWENSSYEIMIEIELY